MSTELDLPEPLRSQLKHIEDMRRDFVANVSHELRTPLTVIRGYIEAFLAQEEQFSPELQKIFTQMYQHSVRMENLVSDLLLLSRLENDEADQSQQDIMPVAKILEAIQVDAYSISKDLQRTHHFELHLDEQLQLYGVAEELKSLFSNLMVNAVRYTTDNGKIVVRWFKDESAQGIFSVEDTGIGIAEKHIPRLTERFYRVDKGRSDSHSSTGLGLAIVKHVLLRHDAELQIESTLNKGSVFKCVFPSHRLRN